MLVISSQRFRFSKIGARDLVRPPLSANGVSTDPQKAEAIRSWPEPTSRTDVRSFLGLCSYYRRFVPSFADLAKPLHQLLEAGRQFEWTAETDSAFNTLKEKLIQTPVLGYPLPQEPFILDTDASNYATGAVLSQIQDGKERVIAYYSRSMNSAEKQYCVTRKELLAIVRAVKQFHCYLYGRHFTIRTDHAALTWLLKFRNPEGQIARWIQRLQEYDFEVVHRAGLKHNNADALSRRPCLTNNCRHCDRLETRDNPANTSVGTAPCEVLSPFTVNSISSLSDIYQYTELREAQLQDPDVKPILEWKESSSDRPSREEVAGCSPDTKLYWAQWKSLSVRQGVLHRLWETVAGDHTIAQLILPKVLRKEVFTQLHNTPTSGHLGVNKTLERLRSRFYWPGLHGDVRKWCTSCDDCASRRGPPTKPRAPLAKYTAGAPAERIAIDILGPLPESNMGNKYILLVMDYFTKWPEAFSLPNQTAITVADVLVKEYVCRFGVPLSLHSDQGRNFESNVFQEMCELLGIKKTRTTALHPQSDGLVERVNRTLESQLSKFVDRNQKDWDHLLPFMMMALRSAVQESTRSTPAKLQLGRELRLPVDLLLGRPEDHSVVYEYTEKLQETLEIVHQYARERLQYSSEQMKTYYDLRADDTTYEEGDAVWLYNPRRLPGLTPKFMKPWEGPYVVLKRINDLIYRVQLTKRSKPKVVHRNRLWEYSGPNPLTWFKKASSQSPNS